VDDLGPQALERLLPYLGPLVGDPERVDGSHPDHPRQTFDYFAERLDGQRLAVEVVRAWDEAWMESSHVWPDLARRVETFARDRNAAFTGLYAMSVRLDPKARAKDYAVDVLADALARCHRGGIDATVPVDEAVSFHYVADQPDLAVLSMRGGPGEWEGGPESQARLREAIESKAPTMTRAGEAGYETHLVIVHWVLGSTHSWREYLAENPPDSPHPQHIWAVDLNVRPGTQGRQPAEHVWPIS
jgi:GNAT superfamily N-acetyltransferase